jgi:hypothetical protein
MNQDRTALLKLLHGQIACKSPCEITVHEGDGDLHIVGRITSVSTESVVVHEAGVGSVDIYPIDSVVSLSAAPA